MFTEKEAKEKWCPQFRSLVADNNGNGCASSNTYDESYVVPNCISSRCMMWRWATETVIGEHTSQPIGVQRVLVQDPEQPWTCEYCDGRGYSEKYADEHDSTGWCPECEGKGKGFKYVPTGYCGLAGKPS